MSNSRFNADGNLVAVRRNTRPANRRALITSAAEKLFATRGYEHVTLEDIADAVSVTPSALYRHFAGRLQVLEHVVADGMVPLAGVMAHIDLRDREIALTRLAEYALDHRRLGVLWEREAHHLPATEQERIRPAIRAIGDELSAQVHRVRPELNSSTCELVAWSIIAVLISPSFHQLSLPRIRFVNTLSTIAGRALDASVVVGTSLDKAPTSPRLLPQTRREALLSQSIMLFAERSYASVNIEDIGASLGIAGPSVYNYFAGKPEILVAALQRGTAYLFIGLSEILNAANSSEDALCGLIRSYTQFALNNHSLVDLMITEVRNLPDVDREAAVLSERSYIDEWEHLLRNVHPRLEPTEARIQVQAAMTIVNDVSRTFRLRNATGTREAIEGLCRAVLDV